LNNFGDALQGRTQANLVIYFGGRERVRLERYLEAVERQCTGCFNSIHQLVDSQTRECAKLSLLLSAHGELADGSRSCREACGKLKLHSGVNLES